MPTMQEIFAKAHARKLMEVALMKPFLNKEEMFVLGVRAATWQDVNEGVAGAMQEASDMPDVTD